MDLLRSVLRTPVAADDKYSRGVVGFVTGSETYPGAAILGVTAAMRTGIGMVRWLGPKSVGDLLLEVRPEVVLQDGRAQAWVLGSGVPNDPKDGQATRIAGLSFEHGLFVIDAGALEIIDFASFSGRAILTPHAGELAKLLSRLGHPSTRENVESAPVASAKIAAELTGQVVLLKGNVTTIASPSGEILETPAANPALATAGSGDVLAGILGALLAANFESVNSGHLSLNQIAFTGSRLLALAADAAAKQGPVVAMDVAEALRGVVGEILR